MIDVGSLHRIPPPRQLVSEHLKDDDLAWLNDQLARAELPPVLIRGPQDIPVPLAPAGLHDVLDAVCTCGGFGAPGVHLTTCKAANVRVIPAGTW